MHKFVQVTVSSYQNPYGMSFRDVYAVDDLGQVWKFMEGSFPTAGSWQMLPLHPEGQ